MWLASCWMTELSKKKLSSVMTMVDLNSWMSNIFKAKKYLFASWIFFCRIYFCTTKFFIISVAENVEHSNVSKCTSCTVIWFDKEIFQLWVHWKTTSDKCIYRPLHFQGYGVQTLLDIKFKWKPSEWQYQKSNKCLGFKRSQFP